MTVKRIDRWGVNPDYDDPIYTDGWRSWSQREQDATEAARRRYNYVTGIAPIFREDLSFKRRAVQWPTTFSSTS